MKVTPFQQKCQELRKRVELKTLDDVEIMLNNAKGTGTTNHLLHLAKERNLPLMFEKESQCDELMEFAGAGTRLIPYTKQCPGQAVLLDMTVVWAIFREAQALRKQSEDLLNWISFKGMDK